MGEGRGAGCSCWEIGPACSRPTVLPENPEPCSETLRDLRAGRREGGELSPEAPDPVAALRADSAPLPARPLGSLVPRRLLSSLLPHAGAWPGLLSRSQH